MVFGRLKFQEFKMLCPGGGGLSGPKDRCGCSVANNCRKRCAGSAVCRDFIWKQLMEQGMLASQSKNHDVEPDRRHFKKALWSGNFVARDYLVGVPDSSSLKKLFRLSAVWYRSVVVGADFAAPACYTV